MEIGPLRGDAYDHVVAVVITHSPGSSRLVASDQRSPVPRASQHRERRSVARKSRASVEQQKYSVKLNAPKRQATIGTPATEMARTGYLSRG
jgi:hypothetical protein